MGGDHYVKTDRGTLSSGGEVTLECFKVTGTPTNGQDRLHHSRSEGGETGGEPHSLN